MKRLILASLLVSIPFLATTTQAARPCKTIAEACMSAGVIQRSDSRQVMLEKCVKPVVSGRGVAGVNVDPSVIQGCKAKIASQE